jgi:hypothetical protein
MSFNSSINSSLNSDASSIWAVLFEADEERFCGAGVVFPCADEEEVLVAFAIKIVFVFIKM